MLIAPPKERDQGPLMRRIRDLAESGKRIRIDAPEIRELLATAKMSADDARQTDRDYRKVIKFKDAVSLPNMDKALSNLQRIERIYDEYMEENHAAEEQRISRLPSRDEAERAEAILEIERRRQIGLRDAGRLTWSKIDEKRGLYSSMMLTFPDLFLGETIWVDPRGKPPRPKPEPIIRTTPKPDEDAPPFNFAALKLGGEPVYFIEDHVGRLLGHVKLGPLLFRRAGAATKYIEDRPTVAINRTTLTEHAVKDLVYLFRDRPKYLTEVEIEDAPEGGAEFLYEICPELKELSLNDPQPQPRLKREPRSEDW